MSTFAIAFEKQADMVTIVQLVRASDCGSECRGFESHLVTLRERDALRKFFIIYMFMVTIVQLVRASDCGSECRGFESH